MIWRSILLRYRSGPSLTPPYTPPQEEAGGAIDKPARAFGAIAWKERPLQDQA